MPWWEIFGWVGSILVVVSLMVPSVRRFRVLNFIGSTIATIYNLYFEIWPYAAMNAALVAINGYWLWRLHTEGSSGERGYSVIHTRGDDPIVNRFLTRNSDGISEVYPSYEVSSDLPHETFVIMHDEELVGVFSVRPTDDGVGEIALDYVTDRFRDLTPGQFIYANEQLFTTLGMTRLEMPIDRTTDPSYFRQQGFQEESGVLVKRLSCS